MEVKIQISDEIYAKLLNGNKRVQGTLALVNPQEGNFNAHQRTRKKIDRTSMKLPHGKVSIIDKYIHLNMKVDMTLYDRPSGVIEVESGLACDYVDMMESYIMN